MAAVRWLLVAPAGVVGLGVGALSNALGTLVAVFLIGLPNSGGWGVVLTLLFIAPLLGVIFGSLAAAGWIPVAAAALIAPSHRAVVSVIVATLVIALIVLGTLSNVATGSTLLPALAVAALNIGGAIYAAAQMRGHESVGGRARAMAHNLVES